MKTEKQILTLENFQKTFLEFQEISTRLDSFKEQAAYRVNRINKIRNRYAISRDDFYTKYDADYCKEVSDEKIYFYYKEYIRYDREDEHSETIQFNLAFCDETEFKNYLKIVLNECRERRKKFVNYEIEKKQKEIINLKDRLAELEGEVAKIK